MELAVVLRCGADNDDVVHAVVLPVELAVVLASNSADSSKGVSDVSLISPLLTLKPKTTEASSGSESSARRAFTSCCGLP